MLAVPSPATGSLQQQQQQQKLQQLQQQPQQPNPVDEKYMKKFKNLQKYIEPLSRMINKVRNCLPFR